MKLKELILFLIFFSFTYVASTNAQEKEEDYILSKIETNYIAKENYAYEINYKMFRGYNKDSLTENYTSRLIKEGSRLKMSFLEYDIHVFPEIQLTISKKKKVIYVNDITANLNPANLTQASRAMRQFCEVISFEKKGKYAFIIMAPKVEDIYPYNKIKLKINMKKYLIEEQDLFFIKKLPFEDLKGNIRLYNACLNISFKETKTIKNNLPDLNYFLQLSNTNKEITVSSNFLKFDLIDQRRK